MTDEKPQTPQGASAEDRRLPAAPGPGRRWVVVLLADRHPYDGEGGLRVVTADTAEEAVHRAHPRPPSTLRVRWAWAAELADPYRPTMVPVEVPEPEWGKPRGAPR